MVHAALAWGLALLAAFAASALEPRGAKACAPDELLDSVAVDALLGEIEPRPAELERALASSGSSAFEAYLLEAPSEAALERAIAALAARLRLPLRCGRAQAEARHLAVAAPDVATLALEGGVVRGTLRTGYPNAHLVHRDEAGRPHRVAVDARLLGEGLPLPFSIEAPGGRPELHLVADTPEGPRPVARLPGPRAPRERLAGLRDPIEAVRAMRAEVRAPELRENALLAREASEHARTICAARHASHEGMLGDPEARLLARGIAARVVGEAVSRASSVVEAMEAMVASPSHRAALEDPRFTDLGLGVASRGKTSCVVALLAAFPRAVPPSRPPNEVHPRPVGDSRRRD